MSESTNEIPGLEYLSILEEDEDEQPSSPLPPSIARPPIALSPRSFRAPNPEAWISNDLAVVGNFIRRQPRYDAFGFPLQIFGQNSMFENLRNQRSETVLEYSPESVVEIPTSIRQNLEDNNGNQNQIQLSPIPIPLALEHNPAVEQMINELNEIENAESQLLNQMRQLEQAHSQLERARMDLINALVRLESHEAHRNPFEDGYEEEDEDEDDEHDQFLTDLFNARMQQRQAEHRLGIPRIGFDQHLLDFDMFLDVNGNPCQGFEDCLMRAVGWTGEFDQGLDRNGNEIQDIKEEEDDDHLR